MKILFKLTGMGYVTIIRRRDKFERFPTPEQIERAFQEHLQRVSGEWFEEGLGI